MEGSRPVRARVDDDEDGRVDRWEYYDAAGKLARVGFSRAKARQAGRLGLSDAGWHARRAD